MIILFFKFQDPEITRLDSIPASTAEVHDSMGALKDISVEHKHLDDSDLPKQTASGHFHIKLEVQKMQFWGLISSQNKIYCSILHLHSKHMVVFYKR